MRVKLLLLMALTLVMQMNAQLKYRDDGTFKIVQFTDTHLKWGKSASRKAIECIENVLNLEQPDLVIFTGDQVYAKGVANSLEMLTKPLVERNLPFVVVNGNHDHQFDLTLQEIYDIYQKTPGCLMPERDADAVYPDFSLVIMSDDADGEDNGKIENVLYFINTHSHNDKWDGYDGPSLQQVLYYEQQSQQYQQICQRAVPSLLFLHIPMPEYQTAEYEDALLIGTKGEKICCSAANTGLFGAIKTQGDVFGVFCGHDHDNDYATEYKDVLLAYGRYSGGKTVYNHLGTNGARVIMLREDKPRKLETYIRLSDGEIINPVNYPFNSKSKKKK